MSNYTTKNAYDDDNIPEVDLPRDTNKTSNRKDDSNDYRMPGIDAPSGTNKASSKEDYTSVEPLPESTRPRKDGPGGN